MKHPRAELIAKWLEDTTQEIWCWRRDPVNFHWQLSYPASLLLDGDRHFVIGPKPTEPPQKMCTLAGVSFPVPVTPLTLNHKCKKVADIGAYQYGFESVEAANSFITAVVCAIEQATKEAK